MIHVVRCAAGGRLMLIAFTAPGQFVIELRRPRTVPRSTVLRRLFLDFDGRYVNDA